MTASDVTLALQGQNVQVASGVLNQPPVDQAGRLPGRGADARPARRSGRVRQHRRQADRRTRWCGSRTSRGSSSRRTTTRRTPISTAIPAVALAMFQRPGSNALATANDDRRARWTGWRSASRPASSTRSSTTRPQFIQQSVDAVERDDLRGDPAGRAGGHPVPADLARRGHSDRRDPGVADRHLLLHGAVRLHAQQSVAVRPGAGDRHRGRRRDRRGRERRAQHRGGAVARARPRSRAWTRSARR